MTARTRTLTWPERPTPYLGYCLACLRKIQHTLDAQDADHGFVLSHGPAGTSPAVSIREVAMAIRTWEAGGEVSVQSRLLRMRADVVRNGQPLCCDHMDAV